MEKTRLVEAKTSPSWIDRRGFFALGLILLAAVVFCHPLYLVVTSSVWSDQFSQILLVPPISVLLIYLEHKKIFRDGEYNIAGLLLYLVFGGAFLAATLRVENLDPSLYISLSILLFSACCIGAFLFAYGSEPFRRALFPLLFLPLMTPWPDAVRDRVIYFLQHASGVATDWFFTAANIPFTRDGVVITLPSVTIEIAQECSGIRSTLILFLVGLVLAQLFLRSGWSKFALMILLVPVTIARNGLRIFVLTTLGMYVDPSFLTGRLHHNGGIVFFVLAFILLWGMIWVLQKVEGKVMAPVTLSPVGSVATS